MGYTYHYEKLFTPYSINGMEVKNRIAVTAMVTNYNTEDNQVTDRFIAYHEAKAKGGFGLIITENFCVVPEGKAYKYIGGLWKDEHIAGCRKLTDTIHKYGTKMVVQLYHCGSRTTFETIGTIPATVSAVQSTSTVARELKTEEIYRLVESFGDAAIRAREAGFDGVEIHGAHKYLIGSFMSPVFNKRTDEFGGSFENRMRFPMLVIENMRKKIGKDYPVFFRMAKSDDDAPGGRNVEESKIIARFVEGVGVDCLNIRDGFSSDSQIHNYGGAPTLNSAHGFLMDAIGEIKKSVNIPVIGVGRILDPAMADNLLIQGKADLIAMSRQSLADPEFPNKVKNGQLNSVRRCLGCMQGCIDRLANGKTLRCMVNPTIGFESEISYERNGAPKKVLVAGGGIGGMEAARAAALKGHNVYLYEKTDRLGGQFEAAAYPPYKGEFSDYIRWQKDQLQLPNIIVRMSQCVNIDVIQEIKPDVLIVATGGTALKPPIPGIDRENVLSAIDVLMGNTPTGKRCVVVGGGLVGVETAAYLAELSREVTLIEMIDEIAPGLNRDVLKFYKKLYRETGVKIKTKTRVLEFCKNGVAVNDGRDGFIACDNIVLAMGVRSNNTLEEQAKDLVESIYVIGDAKQGRNAIDAIREGFFAGLNA